MKARQAIHLVDYQLLLVRWLTNIRSDQVNAGKPYIESHNGLSAKLQYAAVDIFNDSNMFGGAILIYDRLYLDGCAI